MAGPGGGGHSGGGGRGGFSGGGGSHGGFGGHSGGFHGGSHHHVPMGGGWHHHHRHYHHNVGGGGCCSGFFGTAVFILIIIFFLVGSFGSRSGEIIFSTDGYNEEKFQDFANAQYEEAFGRSSAYEDNLLITVLVDDDYYNFYYIAWVGDHIAYEINELMGNNDTALGQAMEASISSTNYKYSLDSDLARVMGLMTSKVQSLGLTDSFTCSENHAQVKSGLKNLSHLDMTASTVDDALTAFTDATGIPAVIVVEDMDAVFGRSAGQNSNAASPVNNNMILLAVMGVVLIVVVVVALKVVRRKNDELG